MPSNIYKDPTSGNYVLKKTQNLEESETMFLPEPRQYISSELYEEATSYQYSSVSLNIDQVAISARSLLPNT